MHDQDGIGKGVGMTRSTVVAMLEQARGFLDRRDRLLAGERGSDSENADARSGGAAGGSASASAVMEIDD